MKSWSDRLRAVLCERAVAYAAQAGVASYRSEGAKPVTLFPFDAESRSHGNFEPSAFACILAEATWSDRLRKSHARRSALPDPHNGNAMELDSCMSSDALLMNVFCYPKVLDGPLGALMGISALSTPAFGVKGKVRLTGGQEDATEVDMVLGDLHVESKLTEKDSRSATSHSSNVTPTCTTCSRRTPCPPRVTTT